MSVSLRKLKRSGCFSGEKSPANPRDMEVDDFDGTPSSDSFVAKKLKQQEVLISDHEEPTGLLVANDSMKPMKSSTSGSNNSADHNGSTSDLSYQDDGNFDQDDYIDDTDVMSDYDDDNDYLGNENNDDEDNYLKLQAQFDNVDLPPGVEASVPWMPDPSPSEDKATDSSILSQKHIRITGASSSNAESCFKVKKEEEMDDVLRKLMYFNKFDTVADCSDHFYLHMKNTNRQPSKSWAKKIQEEWKILEQNLPDGIFVRAYESRMDLLRAVIVGPVGTPYHDGLFVFDVSFPASYPNDPPLVNYDSSGFRLNPNLYECGKVCLSLLNTWHGGRQEMWIPDRSTMLQVLVSIQALILNDEPFFNEPGYDKTFKGIEGKMKSKQYSEDIFIKSVKKMICTLRKPPQHFEDLVAGHFRLRGKDILTACKAYGKGAEIGCDIKKWLEDGDNAERPGSPKFREEVARMMKAVTKCFVDHGAKDCEKFQIETAD